MPDLCKHGHDRLLCGRTARGECRACVSAQKRRQVAKKPEAYKARRARWYEANRSVLAEKSRAKLYGVTPDQFYSMLEQQAGLCAVCCEPMTPGKQTHVDHDHLTGGVRGLLCHHCNIGVGMFRDDSIRLASAAAYVGGV